MARGAGKNGWALFLLILAGVVLGSFISQLTSGVAGLSWLNFGKSFGLAKPLTLNLGVLVLTYNQIHHWQYHRNYCCRYYLPLYLGFYHSRFFRLVKGTVFAYQNNLNLRVFFLKSNCLFFSHN